MASKAVTNLIESFHDVLYYHVAHDGTEMVTVKHWEVGKVDYTAPVMVAAKNIMEHKRFMNRLRMKGTKK